VTEHHCKTVSAIHVVSSGNDIKSVSEILVTNSSDKRNTFRAQLNLGQKYL